MKTERAKRIAAGALLVIGMLAAANGAHAQRIAWDVMGAGGSVGSGNGTHAVSATVGQPIIGPTAGNLNTIQQGFWLPLSRTSSAEEQPRSQATAMLANYPNPFASTTTISFRLPASGTVRLRVLDLMGREVQTIADNEAMEAGDHTITWDAHNAANQPVAAGHYLCQLEFQPTASLTGGPTRWTRMMQVRE